MVVNHIANRVAVRSQVKLVLRGQGGRLNLLRVNFLESLCITYDHNHQRKLLTAGSDTFQDEEPQVSIEKARSYHHSKLKAVVFSVLA